MKTSKADPEGRTAERDTRSPKWWGMHWHSPFVFPGSALDRMTGIVRSGTSVIVAHGRQDGSRFHVEHAEVFSGGDALHRAADRCRRFDTPVCLAVPRGMLLVRHYRIPAHEDTEVEAMLGHLLANDLPSPIDEYAWTWSRVSADRDTTQLVKVFVARDEHLDAFAEPFTRAGLPVVDLVPASWAWARVIDPAGGPGNEGGEPVASSFVVPSQGAACLLVTRAGDLLFDASLPEAAPDGRVDEASVSAIVGSETWNGLDAAYGELFDAPLPQPRLWIPEDEEGQRRDWLHLASAVATTGLERHRSLMPPARDRANRRRLMISGLTDLMQIVVAGLLLVLAAFLYEDVQDRERLGAIEDELAAQAGRVAVLRRETRAIRDFEARGAGDQSVVGVIESLRRNVPARIYLDHLEYADGGIVTLRGGAPATASVLAMTDGLSVDPTWEGLRVVQLRSEPGGDEHPVHFVLEGRLRRGEAP